ncbi:hypothetical protein [Klebsiella quasipneumoniae]|uniref:hypothetical protein n=1 Tax=Klebsiella quasipneumoniae TaxID=1463165 RepID=UPI002201F7A1|nr:hypothetical protein [Klebsiella quasipneumoniae]BDO05800.1 hypothetical protein KAM622c_53870 [Klebsiella quasipneumoniae subsp. quasipneumoniae]
MQKKMLTVLICATVFLSGCKEEGITPTGKACMGTDNDSLIEGLKGKCQKGQKGDTIATKNPAYFCDFKSQIAFNSAISIYTGMQAEERIKEADISPRKDSKPQS